MDFYSSSSSPAVLERIEQLIKIKRKYARYVVEAQLVIVFRRSNNAEKDINMAKIE
jgi:hypothetical protein